MTGTPSFDVGTLVQHRDFLRALARSLSTDEHRAEDAVQETWVAALATPPGSIVSAKGWLARVASNFAKKTASRESERRQRERRVARPEAGEEDAALDFELTEHVARALRGLPEPYRTTIHLRFFKDLSPREIATSEGLSPDTVKSRLRRGLEMLRRDLDARYGSRGAWCVALASLADPRTAAVAPTGVSAGATAAASILKGVLVMKSIGILSAALAGLVVIVLAVREASRNDPASPEPAVVRAVEISTPTLPAAGTRPEPVAREETARAALTPSRPAAAEAVPLRHGRVRVVDSRDAPLRGVRVESSAGGEATTGPDGTGELALPPGSGSDRLTLRAEGFLTSREDVTFGDGAEVDLGTFRLVRAGTIRGLVVDPDENGVADAVVVVADLDESFWVDVTGLVDGLVGSTRHHTRTDAYGAFELTGVRPGTFRLWSAAPGLQDASSDPVDVSSGSLADDVRIRLQRSAQEDEISGRVLLPEGASVEDLTVWYLRDSEEGLRTRTASVDVNGVFRIRLEAPVPHDVWAEESPTAWDPKRQVYAGERSLAGFRPRVEHGVPAGTTNLLLGFEPTRGIEVMVTDDHGDAIDPFVLGIVSYSGEDLAQQIPWFREVRHPVRMDVPATGFYVSISADGHDSESLGPFDTETAPEEIRVTLPSIPDRTGRVTADGRLVEGATVELFGVASPWHRTTSGGFLLRTDTAISAATHTDADGAYRITVRSAGSYFVRAEAQGWAAAEIGPIELDPETGAEELDLELTVGGAIEGRVLVPAGEDPSGWIVGASRGDVYGETLTVGANGAFRFEGLTPGEWWVGRLTGVDQPARISSSNERVVWIGNCTVEDGRTTAFDLDFQGARPTRLRCEWLVEGLEGATWAARLRPGTLERPDDFEDVDRTMVEPDGTFELVAPEPGPYLLVIEHEGFPREGVVALRAFELDGGVVEWSELLRLGGLRARIDFDDPRTPPDLPSEPVLAVLIDANAGMTAAALLPDGNGWFATPTAPAGTGKIRYRTAETEELPPIEWPVLREVVVAPGETATSE